MIKRALSVLMALLIALLAASSLAVTAYYAEIIKDDVNVRSKPSRSGSIITVVQKGVVLVATTKSGDWYRVYTDKGEGYVRKDMVKIKKNMPDSIKANESAASISNAPDIIQPTKGATTNVNLDDSEIPEEILGSEEEPSNGSVNDMDMQSMINADVRFIQQALKDLGFYADSIDGELGKYTTCAIKAFQLANGLNDDGIAGAQTLQVISQKYASRDMSANAKNIKRNGNVILAEWFNGAKQIVQKYESYRCIDVETGTEFRLRPFSLGSHADVEPPTKDDTQTLYTINGNRWDWEPRSLWVYIDGNIYAAAVNMQPHGPDTLPDNGMSGQICMHFYASRQHNTGTENKQLQEAVMNAFEKGQNAPPY